MRLLCCRSGRIKSRRGQPKGTGMEDDPQPEARVIIIGTPVGDNDALFVGSLEDARAFVRALPPGQRAEVSIFTEGRVYGPDEA